MNLLSHGPIRAAEVTQGSGGGGNTYCNLQPPEGEVWFIHAIEASHDDVARTIAWVWVDEGPAGIYTFYLEAAVAVAHYYHRDIGSAAPVMATHTCYPSYYVAAMAAGKTITAHVLYEKIMGAPYWKAT